MGATIYEAITGTRPPSSPRRQIDDTYRPLASLPTEQIGTGWRPLFLQGIDRSLSLKRSDRPQSVMELRQAIGLTGAPGGTRALSETATELAAASHPMEMFSQLASSSASRPEIKGLRIPARGLMVASSVALALVGLGGWYAYTGIRAGEARRLSEVRREIAAVTTSEQLERIGDREPQLAPEIAKRREELAAVLRTGKLQQLRDRVRLETTAAELDRIAAEAPELREEVNRRKGELAAAPRNDRAFSVTPGSGQTFRDCPTCPEMLAVPSGSFTLGSPTSELNRADNEGPQQQLTIRNPFAVGKFEVTFAEWDACVTDGGCTHRPDDRGWGRDKRPAINVSWDDITRQYLPWLTRKTGKTYRLLTEAEWEYVARAGTTTAYSWGNAIGRGNANCFECGSQWDNKQTAPVGSFRPNAWGLHDVHGNVWEWVEDCWHDSYAGAPNDGNAWVTACVGNFRVLRGGSWLNASRSLRAASRIRVVSLSRSANLDLDLGFRVARAISAAKAQELKGGVEDREADVSVAAKTERLKLARERIAAETSLAELDRIAAEEPNVRPDVEARKVQLTQPLAKAFSKVGNFACFNKANYPDSWRGEASLCATYGCNFGKMSQDECLTLGARKRSTTVIHGNTGTTRANECWLQHSCGDLRPHSEFTLFRM